MHERGTRGRRRLLGLDYGEHRVLLLDSGSVYLEAPVLLERGLSAVARRVSIILAGMGCL